MRRAFDRATGRSALRAGSFLYLSSAQYFLTQLFVAQRYYPRYSWAHNTISDLGSTACGYGVVRHCSPLHAVMNSSFVVLGITMIMGSVLVCRALHPSAGTTSGFVALAISGLGTAMVGLVPENRAPLLHAVAAALPFVVGNIGVVILGGSLRVNLAFRLYTWLSGIGALVALGLFVARDFLGIGSGGMERVAAYPQTVWLIVVGTYLLLSSPGHGSSGRQKTPHHPEKNALLTRLSSPKHFGGGNLRVTE